MVLQAQCQNIGYLSKKGKSPNLLPSAAFLRFESLCRDANRHPLCRDTENSWWLVPWPKYKYLESDDFDKLFVRSCAYEIMTRDSLSTHRLVCSGKTRFFGFCSRQAHVYSRQAFIRNTTVTPWFAIWRYMYRNT